MVELEGLVVIDDDRRYLAASDNATALIGARPDGVLRSRLHEDVPPEHRPTLDRIWAKFDEKGALSGTTEVLRRDGARTAVTLIGTWNFGAGQHHAEIALGLGTTVRELEVLQLAADGLNTLQIAARLVISPLTVKSHFENAYRKLGAHDRTAAVAEALRRGLIS
ncbi:MAG: two-component system, NarL family, nitrate/nitrite response regulator NarL [Thermoleophilaceae bacterium]|jgi:DNA-binding CsgD family transcriptional regulator|nr:two-component system, NarL family, nitrate/nitrite response regulator NarL [Thermoleophilaceae bacterium]